MSLVESLGEFYPDRLIAGSFPLVVDVAKIAPSQTLKRGTVLGRITTSGQCVPVDSSKSDGSESVYAVLAEDIITTDAFSYAEVYFSGEFNKNNLVFGGTDTADKHKDNARKLSMFFRDSIKAVQ